MDLARFRHLPALGTLEIKTTSDQEDKRLPIRTDTKPTEIARMTVSPKASDQSFWMGNISNLGRLGLIRSPTYILKDGVERVTTELYVYVFGILDYNGSPHLVYAERADVSNSSKKQFPEMHLTELEEIVGYEPQ